MNRLLWALFMVSVIFSAWGLFLDKAIAGDSQFQGLQQASVEAQVLPANAAWGQRSIGVAPRPVSEGQEVRAVQEEEERGDNSSSASSSDSDD